MLESKLTSIMILTGRRIELYQKLVTDYNIQSNVQEDIIRYLVKNIDYKMLMTQQERQDNKISIHTKIEKIINDNPKILSLLKDHY